MEHPTIADGIVYAAQAKLVWRRALANSTDATERQAIQNLVALCDSAIETANSNRDTE